MKAKTVGWNEQKNHSVHCHAAESAPDLKSMALGEEADRRLMSGDPKAYSDLNSLELFGLGQVWHRNKEAAFTLMCDSTVSSLTFGPAFSRRMLTVKGVCGRHSQRLLWSCQFLPPQPMLVKVKAQA